MSYDSLFHIPSSQFLYVIRTKRPISVCVYVASLIILKPNYMKMDWKVTFMNLFHTAKPAYYTQDCSPHKSHFSK
jgi:hypothetical protein